MATVFSARPVCRFDRDRLADVHHAPRAGVPVVWNNDRNLFPQFPGASTRSKHFGQKLRTRLQRTTTFGTVHAY